MKDLQLWQLHGTGEEGGLSVVFEFKAPKTESMRSAMGALKEKLFNNLLRTDSRALYAFMFSEEHIYLSMNQIVAYLWLTEHLGREIALRSMRYLVDLPETKEYLEYFASTQGFKSDSKELIKFDEITYESNVEKWFQLSPWMNSLAALHLVQELCEFTDGFSALNQLSLCYEYHEERGSALFYDLESYRQNAPTQLHFYYMCLDFGRLGYGEVDFTHGWGGLSSQNWEECRLLDKNFDRTIVLQAQKLILNDGTKRLPSLVEYRKILDFAEENPNDILPFTLIYTVQDIEKPEI
ncbi:MAG: hypothetical protein QM632_06725 [Micrococcaceae bacterium]